jgi:hypothetical protein
MTTQKRKSVLEIVLTAVALIIGSAAGWYSTGYVLQNWRSESIDEKLAQACSNLSKTLPKMIDKDTRLDSVSTGADRIWHYHYTLINAHADQLDSTKFSNILKPGILEFYRTNPDLESFRDNGVTCDYEYFDVGGNHITDIEVGPNDLTH